VTSSWSFIRQLFYEFYIPCKTQLPAYIRIYIEYFPQDTYSTNTTATYIVSLQQQPDRRQFYRGLILTALQTESNKITSHTL